MAQIINPSQNLYFPSKRDWWIVGLDLVGYHRECGGWPGAIGRWRSILD